MKKKSPLFEQIRINRPKSNLFDLGHEKKLSMNMGDLVPIYVQEVVPGDKFRVNTEMLLRMAPMVAPVMHRVNVYTHFFFVPNRLTYAEWEEFITGGKLGTSVPAFPKLTVNSDNRDQFLAGKLPDYMGVPPVDPALPFEYNLEISALPFRAYQMIYNEYYRDQNLTDELAITDSSSVLAPEHAILTTMRKRAWEKDYFTSCLPWAQRGADTMLPNSVIYKQPTELYTTAGHAIPANGDIKNNLGNLQSATSQDIVAENIDGINITVNDLRRSLAVQKWLEKAARGGYRYVEKVLQYFGVTVPDYRVQRPEYLGGGKSPVVISEVLNTTGTATAAQGEMSGHGISVGQHHAFDKFFFEHGYVIGIMSVLPRTCYEQGIDRAYLKFDKYDYYWPDFAHLGEQEVENRELYMPYHQIQQAGHLPQDTFGYQSRYSEYKFKNSSVHGDFHGNLDHWTMSRKFSAAPSLNQAFIESDPTHRIFAVETPTIHKLYVQLYNDVKAIRPMPVFGEPEL